MIKTLIVSLGSTVMRDDAIGHHVLKHLSKKSIDVDFAQLDTDIFKLRLYYHNHKRIIIIDALLGDYQPGTILTYNAQELDMKLEGKIRHAHRIGAIEALRLMQVDNESLAKAEIFFVGIIVQEIAKGLTLTEEAEKAIPHAIEIVLKLLNKTYNNDKSEY